MTKVVNLTERWIRYRLNITGPNFLTGSALALDPATASGDDLALT